MSTIINNIMPIKYGELTIIYDKEETVFSSLLLWLNYEKQPDKKCKYIFLFDDGEICDVEDKPIDFNFKFCNSVSSVMPLHFEKNIEKKEGKENQTHQIYFYKTPIVENNKRLLDSKKIFSSFSKYSFNLSIASIYNSIYYCHKTSLKPEVFSLIRIKSNECMPRFKFAYDSDEFTKEEIVYLIHHIFYPSNE